MDTLTLLNFLSGTKPYDGYPTAEQYFAQFSYAMAKNKKLRDAYYDHMPVYTGCHAYFTCSMPWLRTSGADNN